MTDLAKLRAKLPPDYICRMKKNGCRFSKNYICRVVRGKQYNKEILYAAITVSEDWEKSNRKLAQKISRL